MILVCVDKKLTRELTREVSVLSAEPSLQPHLELVLLSSQIRGSHWFSSPDLLVRLANTLPTELHP